MQTLNTFLTQDMCFNPEELKRHGMLKINNLCLDSRKVLHGDMFCAVSGANDNGVKYLDDALKRGAVAILLESQSDDVLIESSKGSPQKLVQLPVIRIKNLKKNIGHIAAKFYANPSKSIHVIGVTGTNGKSTCVSLLSQAFHLAGNITGEMGTLGYGIQGEKLTFTGLTTPDAISCQKILHKFNQRSCHFLAMEVSSHSIDQYRIEGIEFSSGIFTNLSHDHLDYHGSLEAYGEVKASWLIRAEIKNVLINIDDAFGVQLVESCQNLQEKNCYTYSIKDKTADIYAKNIGKSHLSRFGKAWVKTPWGEGEFELPLFGGFNLQNILSVLGSLCIHHIPFKVALMSIEKLKPVVGRLEPIYCKSRTSDSKDVYQNVHVFVDFAHTPDALEKSLLALKTLDFNRVWVVFGCGGDRDKDKRIVMGRVAAEHADLQVVTSDNPRTEDPQEILQQIVQKLPESKSRHIFEDRRVAIEYAIENALVNDCILIAGKGHENYQLIGDNKIPFSDQDVAASALVKRFYDIGSDIGGSHL